MQHFTIHIQVYHTRVASTKSCYTHIIINNNIHIYESRNKNTNRKRLKNEARQRIKDRINEKMKSQIQHFKNKNNTKNYDTINHYHTFNPQKYDNLQHYVFQSTNGHEIGISIESD